MSMYTHPCQRKEGESERKRVLAQANKKARGSKVNWQAWVKDPGLLFVFFLFLQIIGKLKTISK